MEGRTSSRTLPSVLPPLGGEGRGEGGFSASVTDAKGAGSVFAHRESIQMLKPASLSFFRVCACFAGCKAPHQPKTAKQNGLERIVVAPDQRVFLTAHSKQLFHPWGMNYGNAGRLLEDFWNTDWKTLADDFREMKALGANVVRVHLQFAKFMDAPDKPNSAALHQLRRLLKLAEQTQLYLDLTGLASYRPTDVPAWYDAL